MERKQATDRPGDWYITADTECDTMDDITAAIAGAGEPVQVVILPLAMASNPARLTLRWDELEPS